MATIRLFLLLCVLLAAGQVNGGNISLTDLDSLYDIYNAANGDAWVWSPDATIPGIPWNFSEAFVDTSIPCGNNTDMGWQGVTCTDNTSVATVIALDLYITNLVGTISPSIGSMISLTFLDMAGNDLSSTLPSTLSSLSSLQVLVFSTNNRLSGTIPPWLFSLAKLEILSLGSTNLGGTLPSEVASLAPVLLDLEISSAALTGTIPTALSALKILTLLDLSYNSLSGTLPSELFAMSSLEVLGLQNNSLHGTVPSQLADLASSLVAITLSSCGLEGSVFPLLPRFTQLAYLDLAFNSFSGSVPSTIGDLTQLVYLYGSYNSFTGTLPAAIGNLTALKAIEFKFNFMSGSIPSEIGSLAVLNILDVYFNCMTGSVPASLTALRNLTEVDVGSNSLRGSVPAAIGQLNQLKVLGFNNNFFTGLLPSSMGQMTALVSMLLAVNHFSGSEGEIFVSEAALSLSVVDISSNDFHGKLPNSIFLLPNLTVISATKNCFTGTLPSTICRATNLQQVILEGLSSNLRCRHPILLPVSTGIYYANTLSGTIPSCLMQLPRLQALQLSGNGFTGPVPELAVDPVSGAVLSQLVNISLAHNLLTGTIPASVQQYHYWQFIDLSYNKLRGTLHEMTNFTLTLGPDGQPPNGSSFVTSLYLDVNRISGGFPDYFATASFISILTGNHFSCRFDASDLPVNDPAHKNYYCGSFELTAAWQNWGIVLLIIAAVFGLRRVCSRDDGAKQREQRSSSDWWLFKLCSRTVGYLRSTAAYATELDVRVRQPGPLATLEIRSMLYLFKSLRDVSWRIALVAVVVCLPVYVALSGSLYSTISYQYGWVVSGAYLSGLPMGILFLVLWGAILWFAHYLIDRTHALLCSFIDRNLNRPQSTLLKEQQADMVGAGSGPEISKSQEEEEFAHRSDPACLSQHRAVAAVKTTLKILAHRLSNESISADSSHRVQRTSERVQSWQENLYLYVALPLFNGSFVILANGLYVYAVLTTHGYRFGTLYGVMLVTFKTVWNMLVVPALVKSVSCVRAAPAAGDDGGPGSVSGHIALGEIHSALHPSAGGVEAVAARASGSGSESFSSAAARSTAAGTPSSFEASGRVMKDDSLRNYEIQVLLLVFNNVVAPCLASAAADSQCFYSLFIPPDYVHSYYEYPACSSFTEYGRFDNPSNNDCDEIVYIPSSPTIYTPPYMYYFQCSSSLLVNYVPVFLYYYLFLGILLPFGYYFTVLRAIRKSSNKFATIMKFFQRNRAGLLLFIPGNFACSLVGHLSVLLTFGVLYPPLAVLITLYIFSLTRVWHSVVDSLLVVTADEAIDTTAAGVAEDRGGDAGVTADGTSTPLRATSNALQRRPTVTFGDIELDLSPGTPSEAGSGSECESESPQASFLLFLERECVNIWVVLYDSRHILLGVSALFLSCFLADMVGDHANRRFKTVMWVPLAMLLLGLTVGHLGRLQHLCEHAGEALRQWGAPTRHSCSSEEAPSEKRTDERDCVCGPTCNPAHEAQSCE